jgi:hypothetical protein
MRRWAVRVNRPYLERFFWFADVARSGFEACVFLQECEPNSADQFGLSAPGPEAMKERGVDAQHAIEAAKSLR